MARSPDVFVVVMDCARADLFADAVGGSPGLPFLAGLRREVRTYPGAVAPASWTIPSHASLFTGLYPWEHGAHYKAGPILTAEPDTIASALARAGYATGAFSANGYIQPATGLTRGFDRVDWGGDREFFLRCLAAGAPSAPDLGGPEAAHFGRLPDSPKPSPTWNSLVAAFSRFTPFWDATNRVGARLLGRSPGVVAQVAPWVEERLDAWLGSLPAEQPAFAFVNLLEAHEPYLVEAGRPVSLGRWLSYLPVRQGEYVWVQGRWTPSPKDIARARDCYVRSFQTLDERLRRLVEVLRRRGRWDNSVFVLTSDHGQAFLEHDTFYHRFRIHDEIARVPLWVRAPGGEGGGDVVDRWVGLTDIARTASEAAGLGPFGDPASVSLLRPADIPADRPVFSMADGLLAQEAAELPADRRAVLDRFEVAVYQGGLKAVAAPNEEASVVEVSRGDAAASPRAVTDAAAAGALATVARETLERASARIASQPSHGSVQRRLAGWGY